MHNADTFFCLCFDWSVFELTNEKKEEICVIVLLSKSVTGLTKLNRLLCLIVRTAFGTSRWLSYKTEYANSLVLLVSLT